MIDLTKVVVTGAGGGFARTLLAQLARRSDMRASILVDLDLDRLSALLRSLGYPSDNWAACSTAASVDATVAAGKMALTTDFGQCQPGAYDVLVEATGSPSAGFAFARQAIQQHRHVVMVSKEVESVAGVYLARLAGEAGVHYVPGLGDQPANLLRLLSWAEDVGFDVVAIGKSSEYDLIFDPATSQLRYLGNEIAAPELAGLLTLGHDCTDTLTSRNKATQFFRRSSAADYCEMCVVAQYSGFIPDIEVMHYPVARPSELADVYALRKHGGVLNRERIVDVFTMLRLPGEASFAGGVFVVVRTHSRASWEILASKGHVVSRDGNYACIFNPYHLMGLETPLSILDVIGGPEFRRIPHQHATLVGYVQSPLTTGTVLQVTGHHHEIRRVAPYLMPAPPPDATPYYLLDGVTLRRPVGQGAVISIHDIDGYVPELWEAFTVGISLATKPGIR